ncbi:MAG: hypothetical protein P8X74_21565 [Reinekea sp.]
MVDKLIQWLKQRTADPRKSLAQFTRGGFIFAFGMMTVLLVNKLITPGIIQEIAALLGLLLTITGGLLALWGYLSISLFKLFIFVLDRDLRD